jgi:uncharacterized membrane protein
LHLARTQVTAKGVEGLAKALPKCKIEWEAVTATKAAEEKKDPDRRAAEYVLSTGGYVRVDGEDRYIRVAARLPKGAFRLTTVDVRNNDLVRDAGLAAFKGCKNLTGLFLVNVPVGDEGLAYFKDCKSLIWLDLWGADLTDAGLAHFGDCKNLSLLCLSNTQVTDAGLAHFKDCKNLTDLRLVHTKVTAAGIEELKKALPKCKIEWEAVTATKPAEETKEPDRRAAEYVLSIGGWVKVNDQDQEIHAAADLPHDQFRLTVVDLHDNTQVTDAGLAVFKDCRHVGVLGLWYAGQMTDAGLAHFAGCKNITQLHLQGTKVTDRGLAQFNGSTIITDLYLSGQQITDAGMAHFKDCKALTNLALVGTRVSDAGLAHFKDCKKLTYLQLDYTRVSDAGLAHFKDCKALTHLFLEGTQASDAGLAYFKSMPLMRLRISNTGITDLIAVQGMPLEDIRLTPKNITRGLDVLRDMKSLKTVGIIWNQAWPAAEFWERYDRGEFEE